MVQKIMVIDDETEILDMLRRYFSLEGYDVITAAAGGDDYIVKPFSIDELGARVSAHLRRENRSKTKSRVLFDGQLAVDYSERTVYWDGKEIPLLKKEFDILEVLSQNPGQVFDKECCSSVLSLPYLAASLEPLRHTASCWCPALFTLVKQCS